MLGAQHGFYCSHSSGHVLIGAASAGPLPSHRPSPPHSEHLRRNVPILDLHSLNSALLFPLETILQALHSDGLLESWSLSNPRFLACSRPTVAPLSRSPQCVGQRNQLCDETPHEDIRPAAGWTDQRCLSIQCFLGWHDGTHTQRCSRVTPGSVRRTMRDAGDQTCPIHSFPKIAPIKQLPSMHISTSGLPVADGQAGPATINWAPFPCHCAVVLTSSLSPKSQDLGAADRVVQGLGCSSCMRLTLAPCGSS